MKKQTIYLGSFIVFLFISFFLLLLFRFPLFAPVRGGLESLFTPVRELIYGATVSQTEIDTLKEENAKLLSQLAKHKETEEEIQALRSQFQFSQEKSRTLLPVRIVGKKDSDTYFLNKGERDGVKKGAVVVVKDVLVGIVTSTTPTLSVLTATTKEGSDFSTQTVTTSALGITTGVGDGQMILDHVVLSDTLQEGDTIITKGNEEKNIPPDLLIGKIISVEKKVSDVFQTARIDPLLDVSRLSYVFVFLP